MDLDIEALLASGAMEGPIRSPHPINPVTLTPWQRLLRWWKGNV